MLRIVPDTLTFTTSDWNTPQTISVSAPDDGEVSTDRYASIIHAVSGGDYDGMRILEVLTSIKNTTKAYIYLEDARASETDGYIEFTVIRPANSENGSRRGTVYHRGRHRRSRDRLHPAGKHRPDLQDILHPGKRGLRHHSHTHHGQRGVRPRKEDLHPAAHQPKQQGLTGRRRNVTDRHGFHH